MLTLQAETLTDLTVVECKGRIVRSDDVFRLRDLVQARTEAKVIVLDLSEVEVIGGGGLGMLAFLEHWAREHHIRLKLFSPSDAVLSGLAMTNSLGRFEVASFRELMGLLAQFGEADEQYRMAA